MTSGLWSWCIIWALMCQFCWHHKSDQMPWSINWNLIVETFSFHCHVIQEILIKATQSLVDRPCCHIFFHCRIAWPLKMEISHIFHDSASILPWTHEFWQSYYQKSHESSLYQHMHISYIIIGSCMANLRKRIVSCYLIPGDSDLLRGCLRTTRVRNGWLESRSKKMPRIMESRLKMRVMTRQQRNWLILTPPSASSIQIARILAASYHTGQPAKSTDSEIVEVCLKPCWNYKWVANSNSHWIHWIHWISIDIISSPSLPQAHHIGWMSYGAGALVFFGGTFSWTAKWTSHKPWWNASQRIIVVPLAFTGFVEIFGRWTATMTDTRTRTALREDFSNSGPSCACFFCFSNFVGGWYHLECWAQRKFRLHEVRMCAKLAWATWCWALPRRWPTTMAWPRRPTLRRWRQGIFFTVDVLSPSVVFLDMGFRWFFRI